MKLDRDVIVDLLPAYFSGEASASTRSLVEEHFRENPEFEKFARSAGGPLEVLRVPAAAMDPAKEKLALERARLVTETRSSFLGLAVISTLMLFLFRIQNGKIIWIMWSESTRGLLFAAMAIFFWIFFFYVRRRTDPLPAHTKFLWIATFYSLLPFLFKIKNHQIVSVFFNNNDPSAGFVLGFFAIALWAVYFFQRWKAKSR
jgi:hypothetical protein